MRGKGNGNGNGNGVGGREGGGNWGGDMAVVSCRCHKDLKMMKGRKEGRKKEPRSHPHAAWLCTYIRMYTRSREARVNSLSEEEETWYSKS